MLSPLSFTIFKPDTSCLTTDLACAARRLRSNPQAPTLGHIEVSLHERAWTEITIGCRFTHETAILKLMQRPVGEGLGTEMQKVLSKNIRVLLKCAYQEPSLQANAGPQERLARYHFKL